MKLKLPGGFGCFILFYFILNFIGLYQKRTQGHLFTLKWQGDNSTAGEAIRGDTGSGIRHRPAWDQYLGNEEQEPRNLDCNESKAGLPSSHLLC